MSWWSEAPAFFAALTLLFVPGAVVAWVAGVRGFLLYASAPTLSLSLVASAAIVAPVVGLDWSALALAAATAAALVVVLTARKTLLWKIPALSEKAGVGYRRAVSLGLIIAAVLVAVRMMGAIAQPDALSQTFDNVFHMNAVQFILDHRSGSSFSVGDMTGGGFYPAAWHDLVSLLSQLTGASIPVAANVINVCVGAVVWPAGCVYLAQVTVGSRPAAVIAAGVLSAAFGAYPLLMVDFGVLYPNFLALALLPFVWALGIQAFRFSADGPAQPCAMWFLFLATLPGLALSHPSGVLTLLPLLAAAAVICWWQWNFRCTPRSGIWRWGAARVVLLVAAGAVCVALWKVVRPPEAAATWPPVATWTDAIWDFVSSSGIDRPESWAVMALAMVGLGVAARSKRYWLLGAYAAVAILFFMAVAGRPGRIRTFLTGVWYNDPQRLAAIVPIVLLPIAVLGAAFCWDGLKRLLVKTRRKRIRIKDYGSPALTIGVTSVAAVVAVSTLIAVTQQENLDAAQTSAARNYAMGSDAPLLDSEEMAILERVREEVPPDAVVVGNPWTGSSLAYALSQRQTLQPHILGAVSDEALYVFAHLNMAAVDTAVCAAVRDLEAEYVLDFGDRQVNNGEGRTIDYQGLDNLKESGVAEVVDSQDGATLYRITACGI
ncbi:DUF6541 family protein [Arthrobacter sp. P2b]|uniref:DUF6541 family protein n=1 Tax=Arthrobacter sp. P2b TaxID=1938741 RepID=UPI0009A82ACF|nr:DUF6541 family protein [Arthrobacter sp. P2b]SLK05742.1 hypothetical protein SAMN06272721_1069 [Arthrobacter sp. P2b]